MELEFRSTGPLALEMAKMRGAIEGGATVYLSWSTEKPRTGQQNKALHLYLTELAFALNAAGFDQRKVLAAMRDGVEIPWSPESTKENLFRPIMRAILGKESTTELETSEVSRVYEVLNRFTADRFGISMNFPDRFGG